MTGFPKLFLMRGPKTATGHTSRLLYIAPGVRWGLQAMQQVQRRALRRIDFKPAVMQGCNDQLRSRLSASVCSQCRSCYRADSGRNIAIWPGFTREHMRAVAAQAWAEFEFG